MHSLTPKSFNRQAVQHPQHFQLPRIQTQKVQYDNHLAVEAGILESSE